MLMLAVRCARDTPDPVERAAEMVAALKTFASQVAKWCSPTSAEHTA